MLRVLSMGVHGWLIEVDDAEQRRRLAAHLEVYPVPGQLELVPGVRTVFVRTDDPQAARTQLAALQDLPPVRAAPARRIELPVRYDGPDLADVAAELGLSTEALVARHFAHEWSADVAGFLPGFVYLSGWDITVPRRAEPRTRVPAGAVGLAGEWCGVYPTASPGGWRLIGTCLSPVWDAARPADPAIRPGDVVSFVEAT